MKQLFIGICISLLSALGATAQPSVNKDIRIVPAPALVKAEKGQFLLQAGARIVMSTADSMHRSIATLLSGNIKALTGYILPVSTHAGTKGNIFFRLQTGEDEALGEEGYRLLVGPGGITIEAGKPAGWFYAIQTLMQLLPANPQPLSGERQLPGEAQPMLAKVRATRLAIPCVRIEDRPRFPWRGLMLDVSRHFFSKEVIKAYIDQMAKYKFNTFHFHLTDNQGWRVEIKALPRLTEVGAWRISRTGYWKGFKASEPGEEATDGGFYTQEDIREIVEYAAARFVTIVPEIDLPGHSLALIAAYPQISCTKQSQQVLAGDPWNTTRTNVVCVGNDSTYALLDTIFTEIAALFPGSYIHIGGDEVQRIYWDKCGQCQERIRKEQLKNTEELQTYFIRRVAAIVESKGKKPIGWYENLDGGLVPGMALMSWKNNKGGVDASKAGHKVVMTPAQHTYLDFYQNDPVLENGPFTVNRLNSCYAFDPLPEGADATNILGGQGSLWTEQVPNERKLQYMTWPRGMALAEALWSPVQGRNWEDFIWRMEGQLSRFDAAHVKYATAFYEPILTAVKDSSGIYRVKITTEIGGLDVFYSFDDTSPDEFYPKYSSQPLPFPKGAHHIRAISYQHGCPVGREINIELAELLRRAGVR